MTDRNVDAIEGTVILVASCLGGFVQTSLTQDGVDTDRRLACRPVTNNQFALPASDGNHCVNCHDAGLHRLSDGTAPNDARSKLFDGIEYLAFDWSFAVQRFSERVHNAPQKSFPDGHPQ